MPRTFRTRQKLANQAGAADQTAGHANLESELLRFVAASGSEQKIKLLGATDR